MPIELKILVALLCALVAAFMVAVIIAATAEEMPKEEKKKHPLAGCVTFRDLVEVEHPHEVGDVLLGGVCGCPHSYGYISFDSRPCAGKTFPYEEFDSVCRECWNRPVPKETLDRLMEGEE